jgi:hypothetical protein
MLSDEYRRGYLRGFRDHLRDGGEAITLALDAAPTAESESDNAESDTDSVPQGQHPGDAQCGRAALAASAQTDPYPGAPRRP